MKQRQSVMWGEGAFEKISAQASSAYEDLIAHLPPGPGERWLDVATGTGAVAIRAARAGARVTGVDLAPVLIETAKRLAGEEELEIEFERGDCEQLPYDDASFDTVSSSFGVMFAPDQRAAATELARVTRPGGRLGVMSWTPGGGTGEMFALLRPFQPPPPEGAGNPLDWGRPEHVKTLLGDAFELEFDRGEMLQTGESGEEIWQLFVTSFGPMKTLHESLDEERREELHRAYVEFHERYRENGGIRRPGEYLITIGHRRS